MALRLETTRMLGSFLDGRETAEALESWILQVEDDESFSIEEREDLTRLRLLLLEVGEGLRPVEDVMTEAWELLGQSGVIQSSTSSENTTVGRVQSATLQFATSST